MLSRHPWLPGAPISGRIILNRRIHAKGVRMEEQRGRKQKKKEVKGSSKGGKGVADSGKTGLGHGFRGNGRDTPAGFATLKPHWEIQTNSFWFCKCVIYILTPPKWLTVGRCKGCASCLFVLRSSNCDTSREPEKIKKKEKNRFIFSHSQIIC